MSKSQSDSIRQFIVEHVTESPGVISRMVCDAYGISRQAANRHLDSLVAAGSLEETGKTRSKKYKLLIQHHFDKKFRVTPLLNDEVVWTDYVAPLLAHEPDHVIAICQYGLGELVQNALVHADPERLHVSVNVTGASVDISVVDDGCGIFRSLSDVLTSADLSAAALDLSKGGLTSKPQTHSGKGLFYIARMFDSFTIQSENITLSFRERDQLRTIVTQPFSIRGTSVQMSIPTNTMTGPGDVFDTYTTDSGGLRTLIAASLLGHGIALMTRRQGRELLHRVEHFEEAIIDFAGVDTVGPAFADEVFRVFKAEHPAVSLITLNASSSVRKQIRSALHLQTNPGRIPRATENASAQGIRDQDIHDQDIHDQDISDS